LEVEDAECDVISLDTAREKQAIQDKNGFKHEGKTLRDLEGGKHSLDWN